MNLRISLIIFFLFTSSGAIAQKELVKVLPLNPEIGQRVTIIFVPPVVAIATPELVFSYSNFFEMPNALPMVKKEKIGRHLLWYHDTQNMHHFILSRVI